MTVMSLALCVALGAAADKPKLLVMDFTGAKGIEAASMQSLAASVAAELNRRGVFEVSTSRDVATVLGVERQKQLLGCSEESNSCLAELAGALGTDLILTGNIAHMGSAYTLTMQTVNATNGKAIGRSVRIAKDLSEFDEALPLAVAEATALPAPPVPSRAGPIALMGVGGAAIVAGGVFGLQAMFKENEVLAELRLADTRNGPLRPATAYVEDANLVTTQKTFGIAGLGAGGALVASGILWYVLSGREAPAKLALVPTGNGVAFAFSSP